MLAALLFTGSFMSAKANSITFINITNCDFIFNIDGAIGTTGNFVANGILVPPGSTTYANPSVVPGVYQFGTGTLSGGTFQVVKGYDVGGPYPFVLGSISSLPTSYNSATNSYFPACYNYTAYTAIWTTNIPGDIAVLIF